MSEPSTPYLTLAQVAARTGRHPELLRQWCASGRLPCERFGGTWVLREADLGLLDRMATRARRRPPTIAASGRARLLAAVFLDPDRAVAAADALRRRLSIDGSAVECAPLALTAFRDLALTVVVARAGQESVLEARRILGGFGGRVVVELDRAGERAPASRRRPVAAPRRSRPV